MSDHDAGFEVKLTLMVLAIIYAAYLGRRKKKKEEQEATRIAAMEKQLADLQASKKD